MDLITTLAALGASLALAAFCGWRGARPPNPVKGVRMMPWRPLMLACAVVALLVAAHLLNLIGFKTGDPRY